MRTAWTENPALAIELIARFPSAKLHKDVRWLLMNFPDRAISEPEAVQVLLGDTLPSDISFQLKVIRKTRHHFYKLTAIVSVVLGSRKSDYCSHLFLASLPQPSIHLAIRHASLGKSFCGCDLLLRSPNCANIAL